MTSYEPAGLPTDERTSKVLAHAALLRRRVAAVENAGDAGKSSLRLVLTIVYLFITITQLLVRHPQAWGQEVSSQITGGAGLPDGPVVGRAGEGFSSSDAARYPVAVVVPGTDESVAVVIESSGPQSIVGTKYILDKDVVITYGDRRVEADHIEYDKATGELVATGHLVAIGGRNTEEIHASHGSLNVKTQIGKFYDVSGSVGLKKTGTSGRSVYANSNPFIFTGKVVVKSGPQEYAIYEGTLTSCLLPHPDWILSSKKFVVDDEKIVGTNSIFRLLNVPVLYMPYVTHPVDVAGRQSGFLLPVIGVSSTKGLVLGEQVYWAINRSADLMVGAQYYSNRGWEQAATFRYKGTGDNFFRTHYSGLLDRGYVTGGQYVNQGGEDVAISGRRDLGEHTRAAADVEYLSSYPYREAFTENFNQAVSTDILSIAYGTHASNGYVTSVRADRYQGLKRVPAGPIPGQEVKIYHVPSIEFGTAERALGKSGFQWSLDSTVAGLKRVEPFFVSSGIIERLDVHPLLSYPLSGGGWHLRPSVGFRETFYSRSRVPTLARQVELTDPLNRSALEAGLEIRPPVIERTFTSGFVRNLLRHDIRHTVEPAFTYRFVGGVNNFLSVLRFDDVDVASNTNELEYGVTQRLFVRPGAGGACKTQSASAEAEAERVKDDGDVPTMVRCGAREFVSWRVTQKHFFDEEFGGAAVRGRRNVLESTLNFSGIAFLTEPRAISPLVSRLRVRASEKVDVEWDFDLDTGAKKFTADNVLVDVHENKFFGGLSYARLNAPGRSYAAGITTTIGTTTGVQATSATSDFSQLRFLLGYGSPSKQGLGVAANAGLDLKLTSVQYGALQASYNWNCCGISVEYRKYQLGSVRNENAYRFNFTLVNIGTAGNLRRAERLF